MIETINSSFSKTPKIAREPRGYSDRREITHIDSWEVH